MTHLKIFLILILTSSFSKAEDVWIYTSLYNDTIADIQPHLEKAFPGTKFNFFQAGSEEVAAKVNAEEWSGSTKADILISSDRFWYEELASNNKLLSYRSQLTKNIPAEFKDNNGFYSTLSLPVMVLAYNADSIKETDAPKSFKDLLDTKWKGRFSSGSPLASGTNFTTVAFLQKKYGWDFFKSLKKNDPITEGGNGSVVRRLQTKERPVGWVLMENILRFQKTDTRLKFIIPQDGAVLQNNIIAISKKTKNAELAKKIVDWMYGPQGQNAMIKSFMYSPLPGYEAPIGAPKLKDVMAKSKPWSSEIVKELMSQRESIKENYSKIMFE